MKRFIIFAVMLNIAGAGFGVHVGNYGWAVVNGLAAITLPLVLIMIEEGF